MDSSTKAYWDSVAAENAVALGETSIPLPIPDLPPVGVPYEQGRRVPHYVGGEWRPVYVPHYEIPNFDWDPFNPGRDHARPGEDYPDERYVTGKEGIPPHNSFPVGDPIVPWWTKPEYYDQAVELGYIVPKKPYVPFGPHGGEDRIEPPNKVDEFLYSILSFPGAAYHGSGRVHYD